MKSMYINVQNDEETGDGFFDIEQFRPIFGDKTDKIAFYEMVPVEGRKQLVIKFYDENMNLILPNEET